MAPTTTPDIEGFFAQLGIDVVRISHHEVFALCPNPAHKDRRVGSWSANLSSSTSHCFACDYGGSLLDLAVDRGFNAWAARQLLDEYGLYKPKELPTSLHSLRQKSVEYKFFEESIFDGLEDPPDLLLRRRRISLEAAQHYGIRWDAKNKLWVFPIRLVGGGLLGWQEKGSGRFSNEPEGVPKSHTLFGIEHFEPNTPAILVESPLDAARIRTAGFEGAVAAYGVSIAEEQMRLLLSLTGGIILALDNDDAGRLMTYKLITGTSPGKRFKRSTAWGGKFQTWVFNYGDAQGKDPGELSVDEIEFGIEQALPASEFKL